MKFVVASATGDIFYFMDNKLYNNKKQAYRRLSKLNEDGKRELKVYLIYEFMMSEVAE